MLQTITATQARNNFSDLLAQVAYYNQDFLIKKGNRPLAIISPIKKHQASKTKKLHRLADSVIGSVNLKNHPHWQGKKLSSWLKTTRSEWDRN